MRCNISHLDFNLILLPGPADEKWVSWVLSVFSSSLENDAAYTVLIGSNFLWTANSVNDWPLLCYVMSALPLRLTYMSLIFCPLAITLPKLRLTFESALSVDFCHVWTAVWGFTLYPAVLRSMEITIAEFWGFTLYPAVLKSMEITIAAFWGFTLYPAVLRSMEITILKGGRSQSSKQNVCWHTWEILAPGSISTAVDGNGLTTISYAALVNFGKRCCTQCSDGFKHFLNKQLTCCSYFPVLWRFVFNMCPSGFACQLRHCQSWITYLWAHYLWISSLASQTSREGWGGGILYSEGPCIAVIMAFILHITVFYVQYNLYMETAESDKDIRHTKAPFLCQHHRLSTMPPNTHMKANNHTIQYSHEG